MVRSLLRVAGIHLYYRTSENNHAMQLAEDEGLTDVCRVLWTKWRRGDEWQLVSTGHSGVAFFLICFLKPNYQNDAGKLGALLAAI